MGNGRGTVSHVTSQFSPFLEWVEDLGRFAALQDGSWCLQRNQRVQYCSSTMAENCVAAPLAAGSKSAITLEPNALEAAPNSPTAKRQHGAILRAFKGGRLA
jgi:hypothetical protein